MVGPGVVLLTDTSMSRLWPAAEAAKNKNATPSRAKRMSKPERWLLRSHKAGRSLMAGPNRLDVNFFILQND